MTPFNRRTFLLSSMALPAAGCAPTRNARWQKDLAGYRVRDPLAGYFDLAERRAVMRRTRNPLLAKLRKRIARGPRCAVVRAIPIQDQVISMPSFYGDNKAWRQAVKPFSAFEDAVSKLAAANLVAANRRYADCLIATLTEWARHDALMEFHYTKDIRQGWFQVESTLFAIGLALAAVRPGITGRAGELGYIDAWLRRVANKHFAVPGQPGGTCCNNHYYRRALYETIIGVMTADDRMFRNGMGAIYSALSGATRDGALPLEMKRGKRAPHYQNFAVMYLAMIAEIAARQGYDMWNLEVDGKSMHSLVAFNNRILADPRVVLAYNGGKPFTLRYQKDNQYFAWFEIYLARFRNPAMEAWIAHRRPLYNRSLGGYLTAYFYRGA